MMRYLFLFLFILGCNSNEAPTGVSRSDVEGIWATSLSNVTLMGRALVGESDWRFSRNTFEIAFLDPPPGQAERVSGDWKFVNGKMVMILQSSFPIANDVGATDTLFVSVLNNQMSLQTSAGSDILLVKISNFANILIQQPLWAALSYFFLFAGA